MDFNFSDEQILVRNTVREVMKSKKVRNLILEVEETKIFPRSFMQEVAGYGWLGMNVGEKYGGAGLSYLDAVVAVEEMAYWSNSFALGVIVQNSLVEFAINKFGTESQKLKFLPTLCSGAVFGCFANTEPEVGSDAKGISTWAKWCDVPRIWKLCGVKCFITNASVANVAVVSAKTSKNPKKNDGITAFILSPLNEDYGFKLDRIELKDIQPGSSLCQFSLIDYLAFDDAVLGKINEGWEVVRSTFNHSRIQIAAQALGAAQRAFDETVRYTGAIRQTFGKFILENQVVGHKLAKLQIEIESARFLIYKAAVLEMQNDSEFGKLASMAKFKATETAKDAADICYQYCGGSSANKHSISHRLYRDAPIMKIYEGASEMQLDILWRRIKQTVKQTEALLTQE